MKKKPAVRHRLSTVQRIFFSYVFICLVPVVILAGVLAVSTFRAQQREDAARQAHTAELAARTLDAEFKRVQGLGQQLSETQWVKRRGAAAGLDCCWDRRRLTFRHPKTCCTSSAEFPMDAKAIRYGNRQ